MDCRLLDRPRLSACVPLKPAYYRGAVRGTDQVCSNFAEFDSHAGSHNAEESQQRANADDG